MTGGNGVDLVEAPHSQSFMDGHVSPVPLEKLWQLYWHLDYQPPAKRPGIWP